MDVWVRISALVLVLLLQGCAASDASRSAACSIDNAYIGTTSSCSEMNIAESYQNTSQTTKGVLLGGVAGGVIGGITNGIGAVPGTLTGAILGGALGAYIDAHTTLVDKLENRGVKVFVLGDQVLLVIPSNRLFNDMTPNLNNTAYSTLDMVAQLIGCFTNISVEVAAYTNNSCAPQVDLSVSQLQAGSVARYLWRRGVCTRLLYAIGKGGTHLVTRNSLYWGCSENYRIEITLERVPTC